jgi:hypothetical protein
MRKQMKPDRNMKIDILSGLPIFPYRQNHEEETLKRNLQRLKTQQLKFLKDTDWMFENKNRVDPRDYFHKYI